MVKLHNSIITSSVTPRHFDLVGFFCSFGIFSRDTKSLNVGLLYD